MQYKLLKHMASLCRIGYVSEEDAGSVADRLLDCALGVNPCGYSPSVEQALKNVTAADSTRYPDYPYTSLRKHISDYWRGTTDVSPDCIRVGCGAIGILNQLNKMFVDKRSKVLGYCPQFSDYIANVRAYGGSFEFYSLHREDCRMFNCEDLLRHLTPDQSLVYLDNPNNPTGQVIPLDQIREILSAAHRIGACVIVDEAFGEYMPASNSAVTLLEEYDNLFVVKSFSKGFGLAGLRAGYLATGKRLMEYYQKIDIPFSVSIYAQAAIAAALADKDFIEDSIIQVGARKAQITRICQKLKCMHTYPNTPIMVLEHPDEAVDLHALFLKHGVKTESGNGFLNLGCTAVRLRIPKETRALTEIIRKIERKI